MSSRKIKPFIRNIAIKNTTYDNNTKLTLIETVAAHLLVDGDLVTLRFNNVPQILLNVAIDVITPTTFNVATYQDFGFKNGATLEVDYYSTGMTGGQDSLTLSSSTALPAVIQTFVVGTGTAVYQVESSLNGNNWITDPTVITHTNISGSSLAVTVSPSWGYVRINVTSIGAATRLFALLGA